MSRHIVPTALLHVIRVNLVKVKQRMYRGLCKVLGRKKIKASLKKKVVSTGRTKIYNFK